MAFFAPIIFGALLLSSPWARNAGTWGDWSTALFTSCSAICVTGLSVVDIVKEYTFSGQLVLIALVQLGGFGYMTLGTFLLVFIGRRLSLSQEFTLKNAYGTTAVRGIKGLLLSAIFSTLFFEAAGAGIFYWRTGDLYGAVFHSVMSFCNAGFGLSPASLAPYADDPYILISLAVLTILGGIGYMVLYNLLTFKIIRSPSGAKGKLSLHTRIMLRFTMYLVSIAFVLFLFFEWNGSLESMSFWKKILVGFYQSTSPRTCGFTVIPMSDIEPVNRLVIEILMFVGGGSGSTAAGMKVTTLAVLVYTLTAMCRGDNETVISKYVVPFPIVREAFVIFMLHVMMILVAFGALLVTESGNMILSGDLFFETVSAITNTGLSVGSTTSLLSIPGRCVIMVGMFCGHLGALTVVMLIGERESVNRIRFPTGELVVG
jgi:trk system potassium uptake protein TrkH